ncbi:MAG: NUDIX hydrolase [Bacteroidetes bacterium]|nr:NUDIX hydrolase [Bacteroidota bacterium]
MSFPLEEELRKYLDRYPEEKPTIDRFRALLQHPDAFQRTHLPGHITGSSFIVSEDLTQTVLVHHAKLNRWLQPGGHCDGDPDVVQTALREANEETGLKNLMLLHEEIYDLDIHRIPERKDFPAHDHYDIRYVMRATLSEPIVVSEESHDVKWIALKELEKYNNEAALLRLREKLR